MNKRKETSNYIISNIESIINEHNIQDVESFLSDISGIICRFDTDIAIEVMNGLGEYGKNQALSIKVNYGY